MQKLLLCVEYTAKPGMREKFVSEVVSEGVLEKIRQEDGCLKYDYYYSAQDDKTIMLVEQWESADKQKVHMEQPHMAQLASIKDKYIEAVQLTKAAPEA